MQPLQPSPAFAMEPMEQGEVKGHSPLPPHEEISQDFSSFSPELKKCGQLPPYEGNQPLNDHPLIDDPL